MNYDIVPNYPAITYSPTAFPEAARDDDESLVMKSLLASTLHLTSLEDADSGALRARRPMLELSLSPVNNIDELYALARKCDLLNEVTATLAARSAALLRAHDSPVFLPVPADCCGQIEDLVQALEPVSPWAGNVVIELTDYQRVAMMVDWESARLRLRENGFRVAMDDIGDGFGALALLPRIRPDYVVLGPQLTNRTEDCVHSRTLVSAVTSYCDKHGAIAIAAGNLDDATLRTIWRAGVRWRESKRGAGFASALECARQVVA